MDANSRRLLPVFTRTYGEKDALKWKQRWRLFFMACAELWGYRRGSEWIVCHYLFEKKEKKRVLVEMVEERD
jgi:cyclopropane-fatty-acyl-phospholipid synthase